MTSLGISYEDNNILNEQYLGLSQTPNIPKKNYFCAHGTSMMEAQIGKDFKLESCSYKMVTKPIIPPELHHSPVI